MADFKKALAVVLKNEGGYVNNLKDKGGETYCGISRKNNPNWMGWKAIDGYKANNALKEGQIIDDYILNGLVESYYKTQYWDKIQGDNITSDKVAISYFDWFVNSGYHATEAIQKCVDATPDGVMGANTLAAINRTDENILCVKLKYARIDFVKGIVQRNPSQKVFFNGWLSRINSF